MKRYWIVFVCIALGGALQVGAQDFSATMAGTLSLGDAGTIQLQNGDRVPQFAQADIVLSANDEGSLGAGEVITATLSGDISASVAVRMATTYINTNASGHQGDGYSLGTFTLTSATSGTTSGLFVVDLADYTNVTGYVVGDPSLGTGYFDGRTFIGSLTGAYTGTSPINFNGSVAGFICDTLAVQLEDDVETLETVSAQTRLFDLPSSSSILQFVPPTGTSSFDLHTTTTPNMQLEVGLEHTGLVLGVGGAGLPGSLSFSSTAYVVVDSLSRQYGSGFAGGTFSFVDGYDRGTFDGTMLIDVSPGDATYPVGCKGYLFATKGTGFFTPFFALGTIDGGYYDASGIGSLDGFGGHMQLSVYVRPGNVAYFFETSSEGWTTGGAPAVFTMPDAEYVNDALNLTATNNTNTFGFWQTPAGAITKSDGDLFRGLFAVESNLVNKSIVPTLRLRVAEANNQSASVLAVESIGTAQCSPGIEGTIYENYFKTPTTTPTTLYLAFDMLNFSPEDASFGTMSLDIAVLERIDLPGNFVFSNVTSYEFNSDEGWTFVSVPAVFTPPTSGVSGGALVLTTTTNTDTFGYWLSPVIAVDGDYLYRVGYDVATDITPQSAVPTIRLRINTNNLQESEMLVVESSGNGESSPLPSSEGDAADLWGQSFFPMGTLGGTAAPQYEVYFIPPESALTGASAGIRLAFDLLNFNPDDATTGSLLLNRVEVSRAALER